jgi:hypothetical protein
MTVTEFSNEFDILYDNIASKSAPGLDLYEKSVYLTKAQLELVKTHYSGGNKYNTGFEQTEKRRVTLKNLITDFKTSSTISSSKGISPNSKFFVIPDNVFLIINEQSSIKLEGCSTNKIVSVKPKTHDEYNVQIKNPFKKPGNDSVWRMDYSNQSNNNNVELISPNDIIDYRLRYIKVPSPIILTNLSTGDFEGQGLSIEGSILAKTSELNASFHSEILDRAVELAVRDYKEQALQSKVQMNTRNE